MLDRNAGTIVVAVVVLIATSGVVVADRAELEEKLRQELTIDLTDVTLEAALREIGGEAGLRIDLSEEAMWKLPDGAETRLSVKLEGQLAKSLEQMLNRFLMRYAVGSEAVTVYPRPELIHVIGRPSTRELDLLAKTYASRIWISGSGLSAQLVLNTLLSEPVAVVPFHRMGSMDSAMREMVQHADGSTASPDPNAPRGVPLTVALLLDSLQAYERNASHWYLRGPDFPREVAEIRVVSSEEFWEAHLDQIVDAAFENETGETVVRELARRAGMELTIPYPLAEELDRPITLQVYNVKLRGALEKALSTLGIAWKWNLSQGTIDLYGLGHRPQRSGRMATERSQAEGAVPGGYVGKISIPMEGGKYFIEFMLRESDLTDELRQLRQAKIKGILEELSKAAKEQER